MHDIAAILRDGWPAAVALVVRLTGDLQLAEDAAQEACAAALKQWPIDGVPRNAHAWLAGTARHKAIDIVRRERRRVDKELLASLAATPEQEAGHEFTDDDRLGLLLLCCHPALDPGSRIVLMLRSVGGVRTDDIARLLLSPPSTVAQRLVRAKRKVRSGTIRFHTPSDEEISERLTDAREVIRLIFTNGYRHPGVGDDACVEAIRLARIAYALVSDDTETAGLLALLLLTNARRPARLDNAGAVVTLDRQDRSRWDGEAINEGRALLDAALVRGRPGPLQIEAAIAALHNEAPSDHATDWPQIAQLYEALQRLGPSPVIEANRAIAVAKTSGPAAGLAILDRLATTGRLDQWAQLHIARGALLSELERLHDAIDAYATAISLSLTPPETSYLTSQLDLLRDRHTRIGELQPSKGTR